MKLVQISYFCPMPFWGRLYRDLLHPIRRLIFRGMARSLVRAAERTGEAELAARCRGPGP